MSSSNSSGSPSFANQYTYALSWRTILSARNHSGTQNLNGTAASSSLGATNQWERVPSSFYGLSSVRARMGKAMRMGGGHGSHFVEGDKVRHGMAEFFKHCTDASEVERLKVMKELLETVGVDPNKTVKVDWRPYRTTALFEACLNGELPLLNMLLAHGADADVALGPGLTPLYNAALNGQEAIVRRLLDHGADVTISTNDGLSPLYAGCQFGHVACVRALLDDRAMSSALIDMPATRGGATALYVAVQGGHSDAVALLLERGATPDAPAAGGSTPLMLALYRASQDPTPTTMVVSSSASGGVGYSAAHVKCVEHLLQHGASLNARDAHGRTALDWAPHAWHDALRQAAATGGGATGGLMRQVEALAQSQRRTAAAQRAARKAAQAEERARAAEETRQRLVTADAEAALLRARHSVSVAPGTAGGGRVGMPTPSRTGFGPLDALINCLSWAFVDTGSRPPSPAERSLSPGSYEFLYGQPSSGRSPPSSGRARGLRSVDGDASMIFMRG